MSAPAPVTVQLPGGGTWLRLHLPTFPHALASLLQTIVIAMFVLTFVMQPLLIPSESMERTLLVGDFLLFNKQVYAPAGSLSKWLLPYRAVQRGDIIVFHHPDPPMLIKRVIGLPGDQLQIVDGRVIVNGAALKEPYAVFEPAPPDQDRDVFPAKNYTDPEVDPDWWRQMQSLTHDGELQVPAGEYFVLGDNRNHSKDSRYWGFVPRKAIVARPLVIYFSLTRPSSTDVPQASQTMAQHGEMPAGQQGADDRLGHERDLAEQIKGFARWWRIFQVVH